MTGSTAGISARTRRTGMSGSTTPQVCEDRATAAQPTGRNFLKLTALGKTPVPPLCKTLLYALHPFLTYLYSK